MYSSLAKETANSDVYEEKKQEQAQHSSHQRFGLRFHREKYTDYYKSHQDKKSQEVYEGSFVLFRNIQNHLKQENSKTIYGSDAPGNTKYMPEAVEHVAINRMVWPEVQNQKLVAKVQSNIPLTGRMTNKEKSILFKSASI